MTEQTSSVEDALREIGELDRVIHEPARLMIMAILYVADTDFLFLLRETGLTKGNLSSHLTKLEQAEYIVIEKTFVGKITRTVCRLTDAGQRAFRSYRERLRRAVDCLPE